MSTTLIKKRQLESLQIVNADVSAAAAIDTSKLADGANFIQRDGSVAFTGAQSMGGNKITNLGAPLNPDDAVRLVDLQNNQAGLSGKDAVRVATVSNITLSGAQTIDGVSVVAGDRVLVKNQTTASANGIYVVATGAWTRSIDADTSAELKSGTYVFVNEGSTNADSGWMLSTDGAITLGSTTLNWVQFSGAGQITAGTGMTKTGNQLDVVGTAGRIVANADNIDLATSGVSPGTYTKITFDAYGRATSGASATPSDIGAQPSNANLTNLASFSGPGFYVNTSTNTNVARTITGTTGRIGVTNGNGVAGNPVIDLLTSGVGAGTYNSVTVDVYGRVTAASNVAVMTSSNYIVREVPSGLINGTNSVFALANIPLAGKEMIFLNGQLLEPGSGNDYTISGTTLTMLSTPAVGDIIRATYYY
jgi:phage-related tail fiber protein